MSHREGYKGNEFSRIFPGDRGTEDSIRFILAINAYPTFMELINHGAINVAVGDFIS
jgi:hypothetical protein